MSFGFSAGDFLAAVQLAHKIRKDFSGAPSQFKSLSGETKLLSMVLQDVDVKVDESDLTPQQETNLEQAMSTCEAVLHDLQVVCDKFSDLDTPQGQSRKSIRRIWKKLKWEPDEARELRERISSSISMLTALLNQLSSETNVAVKKGVDRLNQSQGRQERLAILNWLSSFDHKAQQNDISARRQAGTGLWLLESPEFMSWKSTKGETLYCPGIPGAGKTILSSIVVEELSKQFRDDSSVCVTHVYFNYQQHESQTIHQVFSNLLRQLVAGQPDIPGTVQDLYEEHLQEGSRPRFEEIFKLLNSFSTLYSRVFIIIDALDECPSRDGRRNNLLSEIMKLQTTLSANILCTSRPIPEIEAWFPTAVAINVRANEHDVREYLNGQLGRLPGFVARSHQLQEQIKKQIVEVVDGMFLLAHLHLESLMYKRTPKALRTALEGLPRGSNAYDDTYERTMKRIETQFPDQAGLAKDVLQWISWAKSPLSVSELQHALAVEPGEEDLDFDNLPDADDMVTACSGLVTIDEASGIIRLVHYTTQEYFERTRETWFPAAEEQMAEVCLTYLSFQAFRRELCKTFDEYRHRLRAWRFYGYACNYWGFHACQTSPARILSFIRLKQAFWSSLQPLFHVNTGSTCTKHGRRSEPFDSVAEQVTALHIAALFGLGALVQELAVSDTVEKKTVQGWTPLAFAAEQGHDEVIQLLVVGYGVNVNQQDNSGATPLHRAVSGGHEKCCETLLKTGRVNVNLVDLRGRTPLSYAVESHSTTIVDMLLQVSNVYLGSTESEDQLALRSNSRQTPIFRAVQLGKEDLVKKILATNRVNPTATTMRVAISNLRFGVLDILLSSGVFFANAQDGEGRTPLSYAAEQGSVEAVEVLIQRHGADTNIKDQKQRTPLSYAVEHGHEKVVEALLQAPNIDINTKAADMFGASEPSEEIVGALNATIPSPILKEYSGIPTEDDIMVPDSPSISTDMHTEPMVMLDTWARSDNLLDPGFSINELPPSTNVIEGFKPFKDVLEALNAAGRTPLSFAAEKGNVPVVQRLLSTRQIDPDASGEGSLCRTPLTWAILGMCEELPMRKVDVDRFQAVVHLLLSTKQVDVNSRSIILYRCYSGQGPSSYVARSDQTPLLIATRQWISPSLVKLLLENGADPNATSDDGSTPLSNAVNREDGVLADILLEYGAKPMEG